MINITITRKLILRLLSFCLFYLLYTFVDEIWFISFYIHDNWVTGYSVILIAIILVPLYTFINIRLSLGIERYIFYIPILPSFFGVFLFQPIVNSLFPNLFAQDDLGAGLLMIMIALPHWASMILSFWLSETIKTRR